MLRQDFPVLRFENEKGVRIEIGASLVFLGFVMVHLIAGTVEFLFDCLIFVMILFAFYLREMARAWAVRAQGLQLYTVRFSAAGGSVDTSRATPYQEELIAAMGPLTSLAIWAIASLILAVIPEGELALWLTRFAFINLFIGLVTALPMQPLDGGRFLYLYLGRSFGHAFAARVMGGLGLILSVIWLPAMLLGFLIFGIVLIALPSVSEHWQMLTRGAPAIEG